MQNKINENKQHRNDIMNDIDDEMDENDFLKYIMSLSNLYVNVFLEFMHICCFGVCVFLFCHFVQSVYYSITDK